MYKAIKEKALLALWFISLSIFTAVFFIVLAELKKCF